MPQERLRGNPRSFVKLGNEVEAEIHDVRLDKTKVSQSATADPAGLDADFMNAASVRVLRVRDGRHVRWPQARK